MVFLPPPTDFFTVVFSAKTLGKYKTYSETEAVIDRIDADYSGEDVEYHVFVKYTVDGKAEVKTVDSAMANEFFGQDIKGCGKSARLLEELIELTRLK